MGQWLTFVALLEGMSLVPSTLVLGSHNCIKLQNKGFDGSGLHTDLYSYPHTDVHVHTHTLKSLQMFEEKLFLNLPEQCHFHFRRLKSGQSVMFLFPY